MEESIYKEAKILVIDDVEEVLNSTKHSLMFEGMNVETSNNPVEALEYLKNNKVDVILLDFFMPQMNGDKFIEKLREFNKETVIILRTGYSDKIPPMEMLDSLNIQGYIDKLKGTDELLLMTKSAIKTSYLYKQMIEKEKQINILNFKEAIIGDLISNLVHESKDQIFAISSMNESIEKSSSDFEAENRIIKNAITKINELFDALTFSNEQVMTVDQMQRVVEKLMSARMLVTMSRLTFTTKDKTIIIGNNASDIIYVILKTIDTFIKNDLNEINIDIKEEEKDIFIEINVNNNIQTINIQEIYDMISISSIKIIREEKGLKIKYNNI